MIIRFLPDQVTQYWDELKPLVEKSLPVEDRIPEVTNYILQLLLNDSMDCWISFEEHDGQKEINGMSLSRIELDSFNGDKNLLIYTINRIKEDMTEESKQTTYAEAFASLSKYAKSKGCKHIVAFTPLEYLANLAKSFGADVTFKLKWRL